MRESDIEEIIKNKDEKKLKEEVIDILERVIKKPKIKNEISYWPDFLVTIPLELGWKEDYKVKDKILDQALYIISNFEGDTLAEAKEKAKKMLQKLKKTMVKERKKLKLSYTIKLFWKIP